MLLAILLPITLMGGEDSPAVPIGAQDGSQIALTLTLPGCLPVGGTAPVPLVLSGAPAGLSGYYLEVRLSDAAIAKIESAQFPDFGMDSESFEADSALRLAAVDLHRLVEAGAENPQMATLNIRGLAPGESSIELRVLQMDDDAGNALSPRVSPQRLSAC